MATNDAKNRIAIAMAVKLKNSDTVANTECKDKAYIQDRSRAI